MTLQKNTVTAKCPINGRHEFQSQYLFPRSSDLFRIVRCKNCGLVMINPQPDQQTLNRYYTTDYYGKSNIKFVRFIQFLRRLSVEKKIWKIQRLYRREGGTVLDIGSADGAFLFNIKKRKWNTFGLEISDSFRSVSQLKDLRILIGDISSQHFPSRHFNVVTLWHVFEHLSDPNRYLAEIRRILKPDGLLVITLPNIDSWQSRLYGRHWFHLDIPRHLFHYSPRTISQLLELHGFIVQKIEHFSLEYNPFGYVQSFYNLIFDGQDRFYESLKNSGHDIWRDYPVQTLLGIFLLPLVLAPALILSVLEALAWRGGTIKVYSRPISNFN